MNHQWLIIFFCFFLLSDNRSAASPTPPTCTNSFGRDETNQKLQTFPHQNPIKTQRSPENSYISRRRHKTEERQKKFHKSQIKKFHSGGTLRINNQTQVQSVLKQWNGELLNAQNSGDKDHATRLKNRITALEQTITSNYAVEDCSNIDFSTLALADDQYDALPCQYGTKLDKVLDQELCVSINITDALERQYPRSFQMQMIVPVIHEYAIQAKQERDIATAFNLSDVAHDLVTILKHGVEEITADVHSAGRDIKHGIDEIINDARSVGCGIKQGIQTFAKPEHFKQLIMVPMHLLSLAGKGFAAYAQFDDAAEQVDAQKMHELCVKLEAKSRDMYQRFTTHVCALHESIRNSPRDKRLESGAAVGMTLLLDYVFLNVAGAAVSVTSKAVTSEIATVFRKGAAARTEYALEVAGVGKLAIEKGEAKVFAAFKEIEKHPEAILKAESSISEILAEDVDFIHPSTFVYRRGLRETKLHNIRRKPAIIHGRKYSGHAIERMQTRGLMPEVVEHTIKENAPTLNKIDGRLEHYNPINNITVITENNDRTVVTVY